MSGSGRWTWRAGRLLLAAFCWLTALYAFVSSSAFSYLQFIKPRVFPWVGLFGDWNPLLWGLADGTRTLLVGVLALLPLIGLALIDLIRELPHLRSQRPAASEAEHQAVEGRVLGASIAASMILSVLYAVLAASGIGNNFEPDLLPTGQALGFAVSVAYHSAISLSFFLVCALLVRAASGRFLLQYALISLAIIVLLATAFARIVGDALSLRGWSAALAAVATGCSIAGTWTGLRLRSLASREVSPLDLYFGSTRPLWLLRLGVAVLFAYAAIRVSSRVDWDFALLDSSVLIVWLTIFALAYQWARVLPSARGWLVAVLCVAPLVATFAISTSDSIRERIDTPSTIHHSASPKRSSAEAEKPFRASTAICAFTRA